MRHFLQVIYARCSIIITAFLSVVIITGVISLTASPVYRSTAKIYAEEKREASPFALPDTLGRDTELFIQTQMEMILSYTVMERTVKQLGLVKSYRGPNALPLAVDALQRRTIVSTRSGPKTDPSETTIGRSSIILVSVDAGTPDDAAIAANAITNNYREFFFEVKGAQAKDVYHFLSDQLDQACEEMIASENELEVFEKSLGVDVIELVNLSSGLIKPFGELEQLWGRYQESRARLNGEEARVSDIKSQLENPDPIVPATSWNQNNSLITVKREVLGLEDKLAQLKSQYTAQYKTIPQLEEHLQVQKKRLKEEIRNDIAGDWVDSRRDMLALEGETATLAEIAEDYPQRLESLVYRKTDYTRLKRALRMREKIYLDMVDEVHKSKVAMYSDQRKVANIYVMDKALPPLDKLSPKIRQNLIFAAVMGILLGIGLAFLADYMDHTIKTLDDVDNYLKQQMIISLPVLSRAGLRRGKLYDRKLE
jgi:uncharacterized protein involved in exopolysaccharide biosynthesis